MNETNDKVLRTVHDQYAAVARSGLSNDSAAVRQVAAAFGYTQEELAALPAESCHCAPASISGWALARVRLCTCNRWPALSKCPAMLRPITPVPMNAIW